MKTKILFIVLLVSISNLFAQVDTTIMQNTVPIDTKLQNSLDMYQTFNNQNEDAFYQLQTQRLLKNLFLLGFIFMTALVVFLFFLNKTKVKQVINLMKVQEKEIAIRQYEIDKFSMIINNTIDAIFIINKEGKLIWNNASFLELYDYKKEDISNIKKEFLTNADKNIQELIDKCTKEQKPIQFTFKDKIKDANIYIHRRIIPVQDNKNRDVNYAIIDTDYTALQLATQNTK